MKRTFACVLFVITACFSVFSQDQSPPAILVLNSYHRGNPMSDNFLAGIQEELESGLPGADFFYEHMDLKRRTFKQIGAPLKELLSAKYRGRRFHVVITVDNDALDFVVDNRDELFQGVPVVFCGINYYSPDMLKGQRGITGVPEAIDMRGTIRLIRTIQPRVKKIQVISDATGTGKLLAEEFRSIKGEFAGERILFEEYFNLSIEEARALLDSGSDETAFLLITYQRDRTGRTLTFEERTLLFAASKSAVYSCFDYLVGYSILGGSVISGKQHGHLAAKMVIEICRGSNPDTIPVIQSPSMIMMDYPLMLRYGISETLLPPGSTIINKPFSFYATYRSLIWSVSGVFVILMCFIVFLTFNIIKRQRAERALLAEHERLEVTIASIADAVIATDVKGRIVLMNQVAQELTGWPLPLARHMDLNQVFTIIDKDTRVPLENPVEAVLKQRTILEIARNSVLVSRDGVERLITDSVAPIIDSRKEIQGVVLVFRDITEKHHLDIEMEKAQKIQSIGLLAGGIAHDFNNYLTGILGNLSLMSMELPEQASLRSLADDAIQAVMRAKSLTQQLLTFSKGGEPVREVTKLDDLLRENVTFNLHGSSLSCVFDIKDGLWNASIDPAQISQVITNLVINAREAMPQGGEIRVTARNTVIRGNESLPMAPEILSASTWRIMVPGSRKKTCREFSTPIFPQKPPAAALV